MASMQLVSTVLTVSFLLYMMALLTASGAENPPAAGSETPEPPKKRPKFNKTRFEELLVRDNVEWNRTRKDDDMRPSYALLHAFVHCRSNYTEIRDFVTSLLSAEYWPNVLWKNGQDALPTLYIFTKDKRYAHRHEVMDKTSDEIKELLRSYGFNGTPDPPEEEEEQEAAAKKTEL